MPAAKSRRQRWGVAALLVSLGLVLQTLVGVSLSRFTGTTTNGTNVFTAASSFSGTCSTPTPYRLTGFEHGVVNTNLFYDVQGGAAIDATVRRSGTYSARATKASGANAYISAAYETGTQANVFGVALRLDSLPVADVSKLVFVTSAGNSLNLGYQASTQKLTLAWGTGTAALSSTTVTAGAWYSIELKVDTSVNPRTTQWQVDGVSQTAVTSAEAAGDQYTFTFGSNAATDVFTANYDDFFRSKTLADYPVGAVAIRGLRPNGVGTNSNAQNFQHNDSSAIDSTSWTRLDETPMDTTTDFIKQSSASSTSWIELTMQDTTETCIKGVQAVVALHKAMNQANSSKTSVFDGATERVVYLGDASTTVLQKTAVVSPAASSWTQSAVNGLVFRIGYATDASPDPRWDALMLEYAVPYTGPQSYPVEVLSDYPVAYWRLGDSGTAAVDEVGFNNGTYAGGYALGQTGALPSYANTAADFDGTSGRISVPHTYLLDLTTKVSIEAWIKPDTVTGTRWILNKTAANVYYLYVVDGKLVFGIRNGGAYPFVEASGVLTTGAWQHIVGTFDGSTGKLYRNGVKIAESPCTCTIDSSSSNLYIGSLDGTQNFFDGSLDEVALYNYALTSTQVQTHYARR